MSSGWGVPAQGTGGGPTAPDNTMFTETRALTSLEVTAKSLTLAQSPTYPNETSISIAQGGPQAYGLDFTVAGTTLSWTGLGMDGLVLAGDELVITYPIIAL